MGAVYGPGFLDNLETDLFETSLDDKLALMRQLLYEVSDQPRVVEVIGDRVVEFTCTDWDRYRMDSWEHRWLEEDEARPVLEVYRRTGGSAPYSMLAAYMDQWQHFLLQELSDGGYEFTTKSIETVQLSTYERYYASAERAIEQITNATNWDHEYYGYTQADLIVLNESIVAAMKECEAMNLIYKI